MNNENNKEEKNDIEPGNENLSENVISLDIEEQAMNGLYGMLEPKSVQT